MTVASPEKPFPALRDRGAHPSNKATHGKATRAEAAQERRRAAKKAGDDQKGDSRGERLPIRQDSSWVGLFDGTFDF